MTAAPHRFGLNTQTNCSVYGFIAQIIQMIIGFNLFFPNLTAECWYLFLYYNSENISCSVWDSADMGARVVWGVNMCPAVGRIQSEIVKIYVNICLNEYTNQQVKLYHLVILKPYELMLKL